MLFAIGLVIGFVMGLTGSGGALVAIPLFMHFLGMSLKDASLYSLLAVVIASLLNLYFQRGDTKIKLAAGLVVASIPGSYFTAPYKESLPDTWVAVTLSFIAIYALFAVWKPIKAARLSQVPKHFYIFQIVVVGVLLGAVNTFTGLGGGVLLLPVLIGLFSLPQPQAVATSLASVGFSSLLSFLIQIAGGAKVHLDTPLATLLIGILTSAYLVKTLIQGLSRSRIETLRKVIFTAVVALAITKLIG